MLRGRGMTVVQAGNGREAVELFAEQPEHYRRSIVAGSPVRIAVEAAVAMGWERFIGEDGGFIGMHGFGASAPYKDLYAEFGITAEAVVMEVRRRLDALLQVNDA